MTPSEYRESWEYEQSQRQVPCGDITPRQDLNHCFTPKFYKMSLGQEQKPK